MAQFKRNLHSGLQADGIPNNDPVFDLAAEKSWQWIFRWEVLATLDSEKTFESFHIVESNDRITPEEYFQEFELIRFQGLNSNDHFHWQN